jgi:hypothetical protein
MQCAAVPVRCMAALCRVLYSLLKSSIKQVYVPEMDATALELLRNIRRRQISCLTLKRVEPNNAIRVPSKPSRISESFQVPPRTNLNILSAIQHLPPTLNVVQQTQAEVEKAETWNRFE